MSEKNFHFRIHICPAGIAFYMGALLGNPCERERALTHHGAPFLIFFGEAFSSLGVPETSHGDSTLRLGRQSCMILVEWGHDCVIRLTRRWIDERHFVGEQL